MKDGHRSREEQDRGYGEDHHDDFHHGKDQFIARPRQRQRWGETQVLPHVNWGDLFFDLFYVGAAYNLGAIIRDSPSWDGLLYFLGCFGPIFHLWSDRTSYDARYALPDDVFHRVCEVIQLCFVATAVLHIRPVSTLSSRGEVDMLVYCGAVTAGSFMSVIKFLEVWMWGEGEPAVHACGLRDALWRLPSTVYYLAATVAAAAYYQSSPPSDGTGKDYAYEGDPYNEAASKDGSFGETHEGDNHRFLAPSSSYDEPKFDKTNVPIWLLLSGYVFAMVWIYFQLIFVIPMKKLDPKKIVVPINIEFTVHRYGEWIMLMLGESILSLLIVDVGGNRKEYYATFYAGILSVILLQYLHFRSQPHHPDDHAMRKSRSNGLIYYFLIQLYSFALVILGTAYKMLVTEYNLEEESDEYDSHRRLEVFDHIFVSRFLAGSGSASKYSQEDRRQRIAYFFCVSMALTWFLNDAMILTHKGFKSNIKRVRCEKTPRLNGIRIVLTIVRVGLIVYFATLCIYQTIPEKLAVSGFIGIVLQVILRIIGDSIFPSGTVNQHHHPHQNEPAVPGTFTEREKAGENFFDEDEDEDCNSGEDRWPNVTQPRSIPADHETVKDIPQ